MCKIEMVEGFTFDYFSRSKFSRIRFFLSFSRRFYSISLLFVSHDKLKRFPKIEK